MPWRTFVINKSFHPNFSAFFSSPSARSFTSSVLLYTLRYEVCSDIYSAAGITSDSRSACKRCAKKTSNWFSINDGQFHYSSLNCGGVSCNTFRQAKSSTSAKKAANLRKRSLLPRSFIASGAIGRFVPRQQDICGQAWEVSYGTDSCVCRPFPRFKQTSYRIRHSAFDNLTASGSYTLGDLESFVDSNFLGEGCECFVLSLRTSAETVIVEIQAATLEGFNADPSFLQNVSDPTIRGWLKIV